MLQKRSIVCLAGCEWDFTWQPTQEIMLRLAKAGNRVLYVQPTGTRTMRVSDWRRIWERVRGKVAGVQRSSSLPSGLTIYSPLVLPFPYSRVARSVNRWILFRKIEGWLGKRIDLEVIFWFYFPSPLNADVMRCAKEGLMIYQIMSSAEAVRPHQAFIEANDAMLKECDLVLANSGRLRVQASRLNSSAHLFRAGVNLELFETGRTFEKPEDLQGIDGPIVGYVGSLHEWVDLELIRAVATSMPDYQFVFVGPIVRDVEGLRSLPNVRFLGQKPHGEVPRYVRFFDVCIIPYVRDAYTETTYPAKLNEYLALGKPVVATPLPELVDYNEEFDGVLRLAGDAPTFASALREAVGSNAPERQAHYRCVAGKNAWTTIVEAMSGLIEEKLRTRRNAGKHA
ncbi:MAG: glycosyltransferase [Nitrospira sp.]|nr:glycosyltransferase [Nitrospira sp.]